MNVLSEILWQMMRRVSLTHCRRATTNDCDKTQFVFVMQTIWNKERKLFDDLSSKRLPDNYVFIEIMKYKIYFHDTNTSLCVRDSYKQIVLSMLCSNLSLLFISCYQTSKFNIFHVNFTFTRLITVNKKYIKMDSLFTVLDTTYISAAFLHCL